MIASSDTSSHRIRAKKYYWRSISPLITVFILLQAFLRGMLIDTQSADLDLTILQYVEIYGLGLLRDLGVCAYFITPLAFIYAFREHRGRTGDALIALIFYSICIFTLTAELLFWDEFQSRFNFIAVDYLIYTREVVGNIQESYPLPAILLILFLVSLFMAWLHWRRHDRITKAPLRRERWQGFGVVFLASLLIAGVSYVSSVPQLSNRYADEISKNGIAEFFAAFWNNELDYEKFYITKNDPDLIARLRKNLGIEGTNSLNSPILREVKNSPLPTKPNLVFITVESLSAEYLGIFGNAKGLTPNLDKLAKESLILTDLYATGTRTVFGLSALTLSVPPTPGNSIVRRPDNGNLATIGSVLNSQGYVSKFIYGGYGYFDNMNTFYRDNGYEIVDRKSIPAEETIFTNAWGVSDEDLLNRVIKENDKAAAASKPFFSMIMTTSNHRPFTYPDGRIDIPSKSGGRAGGVKYTDYAIGKFIEDARSHAWFANTIFVIVADHTAGSAGKSELDPSKYHIPCLIYAPMLVKPGKIEGITSQIDVVPTVLNLMGISYTSQFYGADLLKVKPNRAFLSNYQKLGYLEGNRLLVLKPVKQADYYKREGDDFVSDADQPIELLNQALSYYQAATHWRDWSRNQ